MIRKILLNLILQVDLINLRDSNNNKKFTDRIYMNFYREKLRKIILLGKMNKI